MKKRFIKLIGLWGIIIAAIWGLQTSWSVEIMPPEIVDFMKENVFLIRIGLGICFIISILWGIWGNAIFTPWHWFHVYEYEEIEVPKDKLDRVLGKPENRGKTIILKGNIKRKLRIRKRLSH